MNTKTGLWVLILVCSLFAPLCMAESPAAAAFQKLKSLAGEWEGKDDGGNPARTRFEVVAAGTAVLETLKMSGMEEMLTVYSVDGNGIALIHYCPTNNQPRMRALPNSAGPKELNFIFRDAGNMPVATTGHQQKLVMQFEGENQLTEGWTWRQNGHDSVMTSHFTRKTQ